MISFTPHLGFRHFLQHWIFVRGSKCREVLIYIVKSYGGEQFDFSHNPRCAVGHFTAIRVPSMPSMPLISEILTGETSPALSLVRQDSWETQGCNVEHLTEARVGSGSISRPFPSALSSFQTRTSKMCACNGVIVNIGQSARVYLWFFRELDELSG